MHKFNPTWTLFLDRDGVINEQIINSYVTQWDDFSFISGSIKAIETLSEIFGRIIVVTNQAGVGKGIMTERQMDEIHRLMIKTVDLLDGRIDKVYAATELPGTASTHRKPLSTMGLMAKKDFPEIDFSRSVMIGDSLVDMQFAKNLGMVTIFIDNKKEKLGDITPDYVFPSLKKFAESMKQPLAVGA